MAVMNVNPTRMQLSNSTENVGCLSNSVQQMCLGSDGFEFLVVKGFSSGDLVLEKKFFGGEKFHLLLGEDLKELCSLVGTDFGYKDHD